MENKEERQMLRYCHSWISLVLASIMTFVPAAIPPMAEEAKKEQIKEVITPIEEKITGLQGLLDEEAIPFAVRIYEDMITLEDRIVTAYNPVPEQTNSTPCQGAFSPHSGIDFCSTKIPIVATNELPLRTLVMIDDSVYIVGDRTNSRYKYRYDILQNKGGEAEQLQEARKWGRQEHRIQVIGSIVQK